MNDEKIIGKEVGTVLIHMYEENETGLPFFYMQAENRHMLYVLDTIEDALNNIKIG